MVLDFHDDRGLTLSTHNMGCIQLDDSVLILVPQQPSSSNYCRESRNNCLQHQYSTANNYTLTHINMASKIWTPT